MGRMNWYIPGIMTTNPWSSHISPDHFVRVYCEVPIAVGYTHENYWLTSPQMKAKPNIQSVFTTMYKWVPGTLEVYKNGVKANPTILSWNENEHMFTIDGLSFDYVWVSYIIYSQTYSATRTTLPTGVCCEIGTPKYDAKSLITIRQAINAIEDQLGMPRTRWVGGGNNLMYGSANNIYNFATPTLAEHIRGAQRAISAIEEEVDRRLTAQFYERTVFTPLDDSTKISIDHIRELTDAIDRLYTDGGGIIE